jgi:hypothetical protein
VVLGGPGTGKSGAAVLLVVDPVAPGRPVRDEDADRLSPLGHAHINMLGRYTFTHRPTAPGYGHCATPTSPSSTEKCSEGIP